MVDRTPPRSVNQGEVPHFGIHMNSTCRNMQGGRQSSTSFSGRIGSLRTLVVVCIILWLDYASPPPLVPSSTL
jgi:hypothetical protein